MKLTAPQMRLLRQAAEDPLGVVDPTGAGAPNGRAAHARKKMANRLVDKGLMLHYVHGGWEITDAGRRALNS